MDSASEPDHIRQLREAARLSPDNVPLRQALADALLAAGLSAEAVTVYRAALALSPNQAALKFGLARAFHADGKSSHALVVLEDLVKSPESPGRAFVLHAKILAGIGEVQHAVEQYKTGVAKDRSAADPDLPTASVSESRQNQNPKPRPRPSRHARMKMKFQTVAFVRRGRVQTTMRPRRSSVRRSRSPTSVAWTRSRKKSGSRSFIR